jgi:hypothetical protein
VHPERLIIVYHLRCEGRTISSLRAGVRSPRRCLSRRIAGQNVIEQSNWSPRYRFSCGGVRRWLFERPRGQTAAKLCLEPASRGIANLAAEDGRNTSSNHSSDRLDHQSALWIELVHVDEWEDIDTVWFRRMEQETIYTLFRRSRRAEHDPQGVEKISGLQLLILRILDLAST